MTGRTPGRWTHAMLAVTLLYVPPLCAQRTTFNPVISLDYLYTDNVEYVGENGSSDSGFRLGLRLPVLRQLRKGTLAFTYSPVLEQYEDFRELDNTGHRVALALNVTPTPISRVNLSTVLSRTQDQGDPADPDNEIFVGRRTERERASFSLEYRNRLSGRFRWGFSTRYTDWSFKDIDNFDPGDTDPIGDRNTAWGAVDFLRDLSRTTSFGLRLGYAKFELDQGTDGNSQELGLLLDHVVGKRTNLSVGLGVFESEDDAPLDPGATSGNSRTGIQGFLRLDKQLRRVALSLNGRRSTTAGGILASTSTDSRVGFSVASALSRRWNWSVATRYSHREPHDEQIETIDSVALGLTLGLRLHRQVQLRFSPAYTRQLDSGREDSLVLRGGFGLAWAPLEKTRLGGGNG